MNSTDPTSTPPRVADLQLTEASAEWPAPIHDCWSTIGVIGNGTCRELEQFVHCRNCPVYSAAALQLLDRPLTTPYRREWTVHYAETKPVHPPAEVSLVIFRIGPEKFGLPTTAFQEVAERRNVHSLPHRRGSVVLGLVNVRGELLICVSLGRLLGLEGQIEQSGSRQERRLPASTFSRLFVMRWNRQRFAIPVDEVYGIHHFSRDEMKPPPATTTKSARSLTRGIIIEWGGFREAQCVGGTVPDNRRLQTLGTVGILDCDLLFEALNESIKK